MIEPDWGEQIDGFAISATIDQDTYAVGAHIPMHLACRRSSRDWAVEVNAFSGPCDDVEIELRDSTGKTVTADAHDRHISYAGDKTQNIRADVVVFREIPLERLGLLPKQAGTYWMAAIWRPRQQISPQAPGVAARSKPIPVHIIDPPR